MSEENDKLQDHHHVRMSEQPIEEGERLAQMQAALDKLMASKPITMIVLIETQEKIGLAMMGSPHDLIPLYHAGSGLMAAQLRMALDPAKENG